MKRINKCILLFLPLLAILSCQEEYKAPGSATEAMSGKWWYQLSQDVDKNNILSEADGDIIFLTYADYGAADLLTSNTNANDADSIYISDALAPPNFRWPLTIHAPVDLANLTIKPVAGLNNYAAPTITARIVEGRILKNAATTLSGGKADSIYVIFATSDDDDSHYMFTGHRDTGLTEDHY